MAPLSVFRKKPFYTALSLAGIISVSAFFNQAFAGKTDQSVQAPPPPAVTISVVSPEEVRMWRSFSGRLTAVESAQIKPQVGGEIKQVLFEDGDVVSKGQSLFVIDPRPYAAAKDHAEAQLSSAKEQARLMQEEFNRSQKLLADKLVSQSQFDNAQTAYRNAAAAVKEAQANLRQAELDVEYATVKAPISGRISRAELTVGNVVGAGAGAPVLASIVANDALYAEFNMDEKSYIRFARASQQGQGAQAMPIELQLTGDDTTYKGHFHSFDNQLDTASGTIRARALVNNADQVLTPGMYAKVKLGEPSKNAVFMVPESAIGTNQSKKFVMVVDDSNTARYREVALGSQWQGQRVIESGIQAGDKVIINGLSHIRPDTPVTPQEAEHKDVAQAK